MAKRAAGTRKLSKFDRLHAAGVLNRKYFTEKERKLVERLTETEVRVLIGLRRKLGPAPKGRGQIRPLFPI
ncbi:MAG TPA: hypothetical protein VNN18_12245 [Candidatus Xenobia bacterium]|nr:hypothetical protein [Candidatus Xenobia bacterium]